MSGGPGKYKRPLPIERFNERIMPITESGCWIWMGRLTTKGYSVFWKDGRGNYLVARFAHEHFKGPIPEGAEIGHLCGVRCCVNPDHLKAIPPKENMARDYRANPILPEDRLARRIKPVGECREWIGPRWGNDGRSYAWDGQKQGLGHRIVWEWCFGPIPEGLCVCHHCDNPRCLRTLHLFLGTPADNTRDMDNKGRRGTITGENHPRSKLSAVEASIILSSQIPAIHLAEFFNVTRSAVYGVREGRTWKRRSLQCPET